MSIDLDTLAGAGNTDLNDLVSAPDPAEMPIINKSTASNLAAHAALLVSPEEVVDTYNQINTEFAGNEGSPTYDKIMTAANEREDQLNMEQMRSILGDDNIPLDQKVGMASQWRDGAIVPTSERPPEEVLSINQLEKDSVETGNAELDATRWDLAGSLRKVNEYNSEIQKIVNEADLANSPGAVESAKNFIEAVIPFMEGAAVAKVQTDLRKLVDSGDANSVATGIIKSLSLLGESKEEIRAFVAKVPLESRLAVAQAVSDMVIASNGSITGGKNSMLLMVQLRDYLVEGHYTIGDRVLDDITSVLDLVGVGATVRAAKSGLSSAANSAKFTKRVPISVGETVANTNAKSANELIKMAADDETGKVAQVIYGTSREDAIVNAVGPEIALADDVVRNKPLINSLVDEQFDPDYVNLRQITGTHGDINFTDAEKASKLERITTDFLTPTPTGVVARKEMTSIKGVDGGVSVRTVIGPADGGFRKASEAVAQVKLATRKYGIIDEELTLLKRGKDGNYHPVKIGSKDANRNGNYLVGVNHTAKYDPSDTISWSVTDVGGKFLGIPINIFDRLPVFLKGKGGSITQHLIPPSSYIDPQLTRAASVTVDQSAHASNILFDMGGEWATAYNKLDGPSRKILDNYIVEANANSLKFNPGKLRADGWSTEMLAAFRKWKTTNDTIYVLENTDLVRQSKRKGYEMFVSKDGADSFVVKPITNVTAGNLKVTKVYDPELSMIRTITSKERTELYKNGGNISMARTPVVVGEQSIPYVITKNNSANYTRALRESDQLLKYRDGHFTIYYRDPVFITKEVKNADGSTYTRAVATSGRIQDAQIHLDRLKATDPDGVYAMRSDFKGDELDEMMWNTRTNAGRTAQRTRGGTLADVTDRPTDLEFAHILSPEESLIRSINSISRRINYKEYLDTSKKRFVEQYRDFLPTDPNTHAKIWPDNVKQLVEPELGSSRKDFTDAVSTFRYIDQMESGFINLLDDASKNFFKSIADTAGAKGFGWLETTARAGQTAAPTAYMRKKAFRLLLAANPLRQVVIQASQALPVILATNPKFMGKLAQQMIFTRYLDRGGDADSFFKGLSKIAGMDVDEAKKLGEAYKASGISSAVSAHSLIRDDLKGLVNRSAVSKVQAAVGKPIDMMQKVGFEAGENALMRSVWLSEYDLLKRSGATIDAATLSKLHARVRDLTLNMNKAGELAYNENMFSAAMQFMQAPHKAVAQILLGNRALSRADRIKLGTSYVLTYGTGYGLMYEAVSRIIPADQKDLLETVSGGLFNLALNRTLSTLYGEEVDTDFSSSMRLLELPHLGDIFSAIATMDVETIVTSSPAISLVVGDNAKVSNLIKSMARFYTVPEDDGNLKDVGVNFLSMFSGASNMMKARYIYKKGYSVSTKGEVVDPDVNQMEAMMRVFGFNTVDEMLTYQVNEDLYFNSKKFRDDIKYLMDETTRRLGREGISEREGEYVLRMYREANRVWINNPAAMAVVGSEIRRRIKSGDHIIINRLIEQIPMVTEGQFHETISKSPLKAEERKQLLEIYNFMKEPE